MANQLQNKPEREIVVASGMIPRSPVVSNGNTSNPTPENKDDKLVTHGISMVYTSALSSNLSQLAELAASQAPSQMGPLPTSLHQYHTGQGLGGTKYIVPGQSVPLPLGPQQSQVAMYGPGNQGLPLPTNIPPPFQKGSIIQLKSGALKRVEDLQTDDFVQSVNLCPELKLETSTVTSIRKNDEVGMSLIGFSINSSKTQVTLSCAVEHPFFVLDIGWSSCVPEKSLQKFNLACNHLKVGDVCIFLSPNAIPVPVCIPQGQMVPSPKLQAPQATGNQPGQTVQSDPTNQPQILLESTLQGSAPIPANTIVIKQPNPPVAAASPVPQAITAAQPSSAQVTTVSAIPTSSGIPPGNTLFFDPQLGILRSPSLGSQFVNQQIVGTTLDGKTVSLQGALPPYYQTVPASLVGSLPTQSAVPSSSVQGQAGVGNGLLVTAVGIVPGVNQPGMVYASQLSEMAQKQGLDTGSETVTQSDTGPPVAKRTKLDGQ
ncbi:ataxin-1-like [Exaiptasia diaphana]|uniref:AXH domain-containing protein n=1 Tax=Exaiptasia diaphana TaxID=2652724 RepID=A0A913XWI3_EXADI|nr:ataxin-1-like [Exaiptasia diaphana]XP_020910988.1 ataxin-1-like [Exaiptasia diaphana]KXJ24232.1 Ataxin-1 [Exaiptasia diaphana]